MKRINNEMQGHIKSDVDSAGKIIDDNVRNAIQSYCEGKLMYKGTEVRFQFY